MRLDDDLTYLILFLKVLFFFRSHYNNYYCKGLSESFFVSQCNLTNKLTGLVRVIEIWTVMEFCNLVFQAWKVVDFNCGLWKVIGNDHGKKYNI